MNLVSQALSADKSFNGWPPAKKGLTELPREGILLLTVAGFTSYHDIPLD